MDWLYKLYAYRPYVVVVAITVFSLTCLTISINYRTPKFTDPSMGFETRGTTLGNRRATWDNILEENTPYGKLQSNPSYLYNVNKIANKNKAHLFRKKLQLLQNKPNKTDILHSYLNAEDSHERQSILNRQRIKSIDDNSASRISDTITSNEGGDHDDITYAEGIKNYGKEKQSKSKDSFDIIRKLNPNALNTGKTAPGFYCDIIPNRDYAHFVMERRAGGINKTLFKLDAILSMCELEKEFNRTIEYGELCDTESNSKRCCRIWSIPNYIRLLTNKTKCQFIDKYDVEKVLDLLKQCYPYYSNHKLGDECKYATEECYAPDECKKFNAVYNIFHYLADIDFMSPNNIIEPFLKSAMIFVPIAKSTSTLQFYQNIHNRLQNDVVKIVAMDMGLKNMLFDYHLVKDIWLVVAGGVFVMCCLYIYTKSVFLTVMTAISIGFSIIVSYFFYTFVLGIDFFPFMNLLAIVVLIGIGSDNVFIFLKTWRCIIAERVKILPGNLPLSSFTSNSIQSDSMAGFMQGTLQLAVKSMFVTTFTTAAAFFTSASSSIVSIRCFAIFAGSSVIIHFLFTITWLPVSVAIYERIVTCVKFKFCLVNRDAIVRELDIIGYAYQQFIIKCIEKCCFLWIVMFTAIGILSGYVVLYEPRLQLPNSQHFTLFKSSHPFELYENYYQDRFWFEKEYTDTETYKMPLRFVWGVIPQNNGSYFDPLSKGDLQYDDTFNVSTKASQLWLHEFCKSIKNTTFIHTNKEVQILTSNCFIENFIRIMNTSCIQNMTGEDRSPCCQQSKFPYEPYVFNYCLPRAITLLHESPVYIFQPTIAGPKFVFENHSLLTAKIFNSMSTTTTTTTSTTTTTTSVPSTIPATLNEMPMRGNQNYFYGTTTKIRKNYRNRNNNNNNGMMMNEEFGIPLVKVIIIEFESNQKFTNSYGEMRQFYTNVEIWFRGKIAKAPASIQNGWFTSELEFYDLQDTLSHDTKISVLIVMFVTLVTILATTRNLVVSFFAFITVSFSIFTIIATMVLIEWKLNVLESIAICSAIGLTIDISLHYCSYYCFSPNTDNCKLAAIYSLQRIIGPSTMAAITTGAAGAFMLPSYVMAYIQIGIFLMCTMTISWFFATFFLMSLLYKFGPQNRKAHKKNESNASTNNDEINRSVQGTVSEQLISGSNSAVGDFINSEAHELSSLSGSNSVVKPIHDCRSINFDRLIMRGTGGCGGGGGGGAGAGSSNNSLKKRSTLDEPSPSSISVLTEELPEDNESNGFCRK